MQYVDAMGKGNKRRFIGAVARGIVSEETAECALENGVYIVVQSGEAIEIVDPKGFVAKEW